MIDFVLLLLAGEGGWMLRLWQLGGGVETDVSRLPHIFAFALIVQLAMVGTGAYGVDALRSMRIAAARLVVAVSLAVILLSALFFLMPAITFWRSSLLYAVLLALALVFVAHLLFDRTLGSEGLKRRVMVLGAGPRAARLAALAETQGASFAIAGCVAMNDGPVAVPGAVNRDAIASLTDHVVRLGVSEV